MRMQGNQVDGITSAHERAGRMPWAAAIGLVCAASMATGSELVRSTEEAYLADRDNGWIERLMANGEVPTTAVLPPEKPELVVLPNGGVALDELHRFRGGRDGTKCLVTALGAPAITAQRESCVTLTWPDLIVDPARKEPSSLELTLRRTPDGTLRVGTRIIPAGIAPAQASTNHL